MAEQGFASCARHGFQLHPTDRVRRRDRISEAMSIVLGQVRAVQPPASSAGDISIFRVRYNIISQLYCVETASLRICVLYGGSRFHLHVRPFRGATVDMRDFGSKRGRRGRRRGARREAASVSISALRSRERYWGVDIGRHATIAARRDHANQTSSGQTNSTNSNRFKQLNIQPGRAFPYASCSTYSICSADRTQMINQCAAFFLRPLRSVSAAQVLNRSAVHRVHQIAGMSWVCQLCPTLLGCTAADCACVVCRSQLAILEIFHAKTRATVLALE